MQSTITPSRVASANTHKRMKAGTKANDFGIDFREDSVVQKQPYGTFIDQKKKSHSLRRNLQMAVAASHNALDTATNFYTNHQSSKGHLSHNMSNTQLGQTISSAVGAHQTGNAAQGRKKLPFGFLVQQEKKELHKMGMAGISGRMRPDSAKVEIGSRMKFQNEL
jgi:hypothetical protein